MQAAYLLALYYQSQRYNFESKSQRRHFCPIQTHAVLPITKIQFWKQITTAQPGNSEASGCITNHKDTILKANHNTESEGEQLLRAVLPITKIQFWKQITTGMCGGKYPRQLYYQSQRYNFESKSQRGTPYNPGDTAVLPITKIQFWKQITTGTLSLRYLPLLYYQSQRYNFESKSQPKHIFR